MRYWSALYVVLNSVQMALGTLCGIVIFLCTACLMSLYMICILRPIKIQIKTIHVTCRFSAVQVKHYLTSILPVLPETKLK